MNLWRKIVGLVKAWWNPYRGADRWTPSRSTVPGQAQDARLDLTAAQRLELVHKARDFERNNAVANRLGDLFEQYVVGPKGLQILADSSDEDWNEAAKDWWDVWQKYCDLTSQLCFGTVQSIAARTWFFDGEVFILKTRSPQTLRPRLQLIEGHRCETPPHLSPGEGKNIIDGIEIEPSTGRPIAYYFRDSAEMIAEPARYRRVASENVIHIFEPSRPGQMRGTPFLTPVLNDLLDLEDLQTLEMTAAKDAAQVSNVLTSEGEEFDPATIRRSRGPATTQDSSGNDVEQQRMSHYRNVIGAKMIALRAGEKLEQFRSERPSVASRDYWEYLTEKICAGVGISKLLVFPRSMQGTVARAELDIANSFFKARSAVFADAMTRLYEWVMEWAVKYDRALDGAPEDWYACDIRPPRAVNVDVGRNSEAMLKELEAGATTFREIYAALGQSETVQLRQKAKEAKYIRQLAEEFGVDPSEISTRQIDRPERISTEPKDPVPPEPAPGTTDTETEDAITDALLNSGVDAQLIPAALQAVTEAIQKQR